MDEFKIWLYVIIGVIYVLTRLRKKPAKPPVEQRSFEQQERPSFPTSDRPKQPTFEELLKEITEAKKPAAKPVKFKPKPRQPVVVDYDDNIPGEEQDLEDVNYGQPKFDQAKKDQSYATFAKENRKPFYTPSLEETMRVEDTDVKFGKFKVFEEEEKANVLGDYLQELRDPEGFKKAFVMTEILKRKY